MRDPGVRLREVAAGLGITERSAQTIVADLAAAGYVVKHKHGRRNRYQIQAHLPLPEPARPESAISDVLALLMGGRGGRRQRRRRLLADPRNRTGTPASTTTATGPPAGTTTESGGISA